MNDFSLLPPENKEPIKVARVLHYLYEGGLLNRFEAASLLHDTCLNSTISNIRNDLCITINGKSEIFKGYKNLQTICNRYWMETSPENIEKAYRVLVIHFGYQPNIRPAA